MTQKELAQKLNIELQYRKKRLYVELCTGRKRN